MIPVELSKIIIDEKNPEQIIVLKEKDGDRVFPIMIGLIEASSIKMKLSGVDLPRPLTHDLLVSVVHGLGASLDRVIIDDLVEDIFHAKLVVITPEGQKRQIDTRPSDGVAIAVRAGIPFLSRNAF
jgi:bifunctional DNase/RNase